VVGEGVDHPLAASLGEQLAEMAGDEELGHRDEGVEERTDAQKRQPDLHDLPSGVGRRGDRAGRGNRVQRPHEAVPGARPLGQDEAGRPEDEQKGDEQAEQGQAADDPLKLAVGAHQAPRVAASSCGVWRGSIAQ